MIRFFSPGFAKVLISKSFNEADFLRQLMRPPFISWIHISCFWPCTHLCSRNIYEIVEGSDQATKHLHHLQFEPFAKHSDRQGNQLAVRFCSITLLKNFDHQNESKERADIEIPEDNLPASLASTGCSEKTRLCSKTYRTLNIQTAGKSFGTASF